MKPRKAAWSAWETERVGALAAAVTHVKALVGAAQTFSDAVALRAQQAAIAVGTARGTAVTAFAAADNHAETVGYDAQRDRLAEWHDQAVHELPLADLRYIEFFPVHEAALASLEPRWWESFIPIWGTAYSAANNFSKGNLRSGLIDLALGLPIYGAGKALVKGAGHLGARLGRQAAQAGRRMSQAARTVLTPRGPLVASARNRGFAYNIFSRGASTETSTALVRHPFSSGASHITTTKRLAEWPNSSTLGGPKGLFVSPKAQIDDLFGKASSRADIEMALGLERGSLTGGDLIRFDLTDPFRRNLRLPVDGNIHHRPGTGLTTGNLNEGIIDSPLFSDPGLSRTLMSWL